MMMSHAPVDIEATSIAVLMGRKVATAAIVVNMTDLGEAAIRIYVYPSDQWGCGAYRMKWPALAINEPGMSVEVVEPGTRKVEVNIDQAGNVAGEQFPADADVVVFQRPTNQWIAQLIPLLQARGVAVVVELDDDLAHVHPSNPAFDMLQPVLRRGNQTAPNLHSVARLADAIDLADMVVVSTAELASRYGVHGRVRLLRNRVPRYYLTIPHTDSAVIGWGGSVHSHPHDLQQVGSAVAALVRQGAEVHTVGDPVGVGRALGLRADPPSAGPVALDDYPAAIARFGVGIAPLADTRFNRAKSWLKPLEYAAVGVPWVGSPLPEYAELHGLGCGRLASRPKHWQAALSALTGSEQLRREASEQGRVVAAGNTIELHAWRWAEAWTDAITNRRARLAAPRSGKSSNRAKGRQRGSLSNRARTLRT
jgi:hypothetical protein